MPVTAVQDVLLLGVSGELQCCMCYGNMWYESLINSGNFHCIQCGAQYCLHLAAAVLPHTVTRPCSVWNVTTVIYTSSSPGACGPGEARCQQQCDTAA